MQIRVVVKTGAKQNLATKIGDSEYKICVKSRAIDGKANNDVIKVLAEYFAMPKTNIEILKGATNKYKTIQINK